MNHQLSGCIEVCIHHIETYIDSNTESSLGVKLNVNRWSKKEILGHLADSAINNIKRFSEAQFSPRPFIIYSYNQDELVRVNHYGDMPMAQILSLCKQLNLFVAHIINIQTPYTFEYEVLINKTQQIRTLYWLMHDYVEHLEHHCKQIME